MEKESFSAGDNDEPAGEEQCQCDCDSKRMLSQALQQSQGKLKALEEYNKRISERLEAQEMAWRDEKDGLLKALAECENNLNEKTWKVQGLEEKISRAECALERLTKSKGDLIEEASKRELEMQQLVERLAQAEFEVQCLQNGKGGDTHLLSAALQTKSKAVEEAQRSLSEKDNLISQLSDQLYNLQDIQGKYVSLEKEFSERERELQLLMESQNTLKRELRIAAEKHDKEMAAINCKLQESLNSNSLKDSKIEAITNDLQASQLTFASIRGSKENAEHEANKLKEELAIAHEVQLSNHVALENAAKEITALKALLLEKDGAITNLKSQKSHSEEQDHHRTESIIKELQELKSVEVDLRKMLDESQRKVSALEELRKRDIEALTTRETSWMEEREQMIASLNSLHDDLTVKEAITKELREKFSCAEDAMSSLLVSKTVLLQEVSELKAELKQLSLHTKYSESTIDFSEKSEKEDLADMHQLLNLKTKEIENLRNDLAQHQRQIASMTADMISLREIQLIHVTCGDVLKRKEEELNAISMYQETYKHQLNKLQEEYNQKTENMAAELDKALEYKVTTENRLDELKAELERMNVALDRAQASRTESKAEIDKLLESLEGQQEENLTLQQNLRALELNHRNEVEELQALICRKEAESVELRRQINNLGLTLSHATQQEREWREEEAKQGVLIKELREKALQYSELHELHQKALSQWSDKENSWLTERENMMSQIEIIDKKLTIKERSLENKSAGFDALKSSHERLEQKLASTEEQNAQLLLKLDEVNSRFETRNRECKTLEEKLFCTSSDLAALLREKESILAQSKEKIDTLESEMFIKLVENDKLCCQTASLTEEVRLHQQKVEDLEQHIVLLKASLSEKTLENLKLTEIKESVEKDYFTTSEELELAKAKMESYEKDLRNYMSTSDQKLQQTLKLMQNKEEEFSELLKCLEDREYTLNELNATIRTIQEENGVLKQSVTALQEKVDLFALEVNNEKCKTENLRGLLEEKEAIIASKAEELDSLSLKLQSAMTLSGTVAKYDEKVKELEEAVAEANTCLQEREERLIASEWAVQQLANEVSKAKNSLARKEREETLLQNRLSDAENLLKAKETELMDMDCYMQNLLKKNANKQSEVEKLAQAFARMQEKEAEWKMEREKLEAEIQRIGGFLDAKVAEMSHAEEQIKQKLEKEYMMETAIESLKSQLAHHVELLEEERSKSELLHQNLESVRNNESQAVDSLRDTESKLQEAERIFKEQVKRLQENLSEAQEELVASSSKQKELETNLLAALEEISTQKEKSCALSQVAAEKGNALKDLQHQFDILQDFSNEQKMLVRDKDVEVTRTANELKCYIDKERMLTKNISVLKVELEKVKTQLQKMQEHNGFLTSRVETMTTGMLAKTEEIDVLKQNQKNMQSMLTERESRVNELQNELDISFRSLQEKEAEINLVRQSLESAEIGLLKVREDMHHNHDTFDRVLARLSTAEENSQALKSKVDNMKENFEAALVAFQNQVDMELEARYKMFEISNAEWECTSSKLISELEAYCKNETSVEVQVTALIKAATDMKFLLKNDEGISALKTMLFSENKDLSAGAELQDKNMEIVADFDDCGQTSVHCEYKENFKATSMLLELQTVMRELQLEQYRRRNTEGMIIQKTKDTLGQLREKEYQIQELVLEIQSLTRREEEYRGWIQELMDIHFELEKEVRKAMSLTTITGFPESEVPQWQRDIAQLRSQVTVSTHEIHNLCGMWGFINEAHQQYMLSKMRSFNEELKSNSISLDKHCEDQALSSVFTMELQEELARLKMTVLSSIQQRDSQLVDAVTKAEALQRSLQENDEERAVALGMVEDLKRRLQRNAEEGKDAHVNISKLQLVLQDSLKLLDPFQRDDLSTNDLQCESDISSAEKEESDPFSWSEDIRKAFLLAERLHLQLKSVERERSEKLAEWMRKAQTAASRNSNLAEELAVLKCRVESTHEMEQRMETELQNWKAKAATITDEANNLRSELSKACDALDDLKLCVKSKEEELSCLQTSLGAVNERKQSVDWELAVATDQITDLKEKQVSFEKQIERFKETESQACHDKKALQSELSAAQQIIRQLEHANTLLQSELTATQDAIKRLQDGKNQLEQELRDMHAKDKLRDQENIALMSKLEDVSDLEKKLEVADREILQLQDLCQRLKADVTSVQEASGLREGMLRTALTKVRESSSENRIIVESKLQTLYETLTNDDNNNDQATRSMLGKENTPSASSKGTTENKDQDEFDWDRYMQLCDSIIRRHDTLEKQLETLEASASGQRQNGTNRSPSSGWAMASSREPRQGEQTMEIEDAVEGRENRRKSKSKSKRGEMSAGLESYSCRDGSRMPLQPVLSQVGTPSPCAKRHRSNSSSSLTNWKSQNDSPHCTSSVPQGAIAASPVQKSISFSEN